MAKQLSQHGYTTDTVEEDWGWCVLCEQSDYLLWVGCGGIFYPYWSGENLNAPQPIGSDIEWNIFTEIEIPFFKLSSHLKNWLGKIDLTTPKNKLDKTVQQIISMESALRILKH